MKTWANRVVLVLVVASYVIGVLCISNYSFAYDLNPCLSGVFIIGEGYEIGIIEMVGCQEWESLANEKAMSIILEDEDGDGKYIIPGPHNDDQLGIRHYIYLASGLAPIYVVEYPGLIQVVPMSRATWESFNIEEITPEGSQFYVEEGVVWEVEGEKIHGAPWIIY